MTTDTLKRTTEPQHKGVESAILLGAGAGLTAVGQQALHAASNQPTVSTQLVAGSTAAAAGAVLLMGGSMIPFIKRDPKSTHKPQDSVGEEPKELGVGGALAMTALSTPVAMWAIDASHQAMSMGKEIGAQVSYIVGGFWILMTIVSVGEGVKAVINRVRKVESTSA